MTAKPDYYSSFFLQQVESYRELYLSEQEQKLDVKSELENCKVYIWVLHPPISCVNNEYLSHAFHCLLLLITFMVSG